ncbi:MAG: type IV secretion system DNA-binding domain-containing protein [Candidatus Roizmanbacteria bacterium]|nr:type IV secretion system DNA-binding domain-containing protein [Candidatus Roizmanbacteria bacterium]
MYLLLRPAKTEETNASSQVGLLASFLSIGKRSWLDKLFLRSPKVLSFEIASIDQRTRFYLNPPHELDKYFESQLVSQYPKTLVVEEKEDPLREVVKGKYVACASLTLAYGNQYPIKTHKDGKDSGMLNTSVLGFLGKLEPHESAFIQIIVKAPGSQEHAQSAIRATMSTTQQTEKGIKQEKNPFASFVSEKLANPLLEADIRLVLATTDKKQAKERLKELAGTFGVYTKSESNNFVPHIIDDWGKKGFFRHVALRQFRAFKKPLTLNLDELASLWSLPGKQSEKVKGIWWGKTYLSESPDNLPTTAEGSKNTAEDINFFAKTEWRNREVNFGIKNNDRGKHMYIIGKTGTGKSTLIANMAINDIRNGKGVAVIDPHGDLSEMILNYIPKRRVNDVVYLDPTLSADRSFTINLFDQEGSEHTDVVASGIVSVFYKLYHNSWGPRLEYMLRNTILTLLLYGDATFIDMPKLLTNQSFRNKVVEKIGKNDEVLSAFWKSEFDKMGERLRTESISPILNKVGQFLSSVRIRNIMDSNKSTFSFDDIMNNEKILIVNLSQGKLGEDTTALLGAMFITKMQLTAMRRVNIPESERKDFYLYVDEFQNFATTSFVKILSEARKYKLNLALANQYIGQVEEEIQKAIFGNVGTLTTFLVGARDASLFEKEFGGKFSADDLVNLGKYEVILKMAIDGLTSEPFIAKTMAPPAVVNNQKDKIIKRCLELYYKKNK